MGSREIWLRAALTVAAVVVLAPVLPVVLSGFLPDMPVLANVSRLVVPWLPWLLLLSTLAGVLALLAVRAGGQALQKVVAFVALVTVVGAAYAVFRVQTDAASAGATIDWARAAGTGGVAMPTADEEVVFATVDGTPLHAQIWRPLAAGSSNLPRPTIAVFVHGGSFTGGGIGGRPWLFRSWANQGITVVDVEYRLAPPPRWDQAPGDVVCALSWVETNAVDLVGGASIYRLAVIGDSAGANLAMLVADPSASGEPAVTSCERPRQPDAVIAIEPAADLAGIWADHSVPGDGTPFPEAYIGGPPSEYPSRYFIDSPIKWVDEHVPPTLIVAAGNDHLILAPRTADLAHGLAAAGNDCRIVTVPFAEHGIAAGPDDYGEQVEEQLIPRYVAALEAQEATSGVVSIGKACE